MGLEGPTGEHEIPGCNGTNGCDGELGFPGFMGSRGPPGRSGDQGIEGDPGDGGINSPGIYKDYIIWGLVSKGFSWIH